MERKFEQIINEGKKNGESIEAINAKLTEAGANFHLNPDGSVAGWTEQEMAEGFMPGEPAKDVKRELDMSRKMEFAGTKQIQWIPGGKYEVEYDADGYARKASKIK